HDAHHVERHHVVEAVVVELQVERVALRQRDVPPAVAIHAILRSLQHLGRQVDAGDVAVMRIRLEREARADADLEHARAGLDPERANDPNDPREEDAPEEQVVQMRELVVERALMRLGVRDGHPTLPPSRTRRATTRHPHPSGLPPYSTGHAAVLPRSSRLKEVMSRRRNRHWRPRLNAGRTLLRASSFTVSGLRSSISATSLLFNSMSSLSSMARPTRRPTGSGRSRPSRGGVE